MTLAPRRPKFTEGRKFVGADGVEWTLPALDRSSWDRFPSIRAWYEVAMVPGEGGVMAEGTDPGRLARDMLRELIEANYEATVEDIAGMLIHELKWSHEPMNAVMAAIAEHGVSFGLLLLIDLQGLDRSGFDALYLAAMLKQVPVGMYSHVGPIFDN